jgi:hypothetical protein
MKEILYFTLMFLFLSSCSSTKKMMQRGNYDAIINKSIKKLIKKPGSEKDAINLDKAYVLANDRDLERIKYLKMEGTPNTWDEIFQRYSALKARQARVKKVLPLSIGGQYVNYEYTDYDAEIVESKSKAAEYYYQHAKKIMAADTKGSYREAYYELRRAEEYKEGIYPDLNNLIEEARLKGISRVLVNTINNTHLRLSEEFMDNLLAFNTNGLNSEWIEYHLRPLDRNIRYDYYVDIKLQIIDVSPENVKTKDRIIKATVEDGFEYMLDKNGNVMKDSVGNDIKVKKYKELTCTVIERLQEKSVGIKGEIEIISLNPKRILKKDPIAASTHFEHLSARAVGDIEALNQATRRLIEVGPLPFPDDFTMIYDCSEALKNSIRDVITHNKYYIK